MVWESEMCETLGKGFQAEPGQLQRPRGERDFVSSGTRNKANEAGSKSAGGISRMFWRYSRGPDVLRTLSLVRILDLILYEVLCEGH